METIKEIELAIGNANKIHASVRKEVLRPHPRKVPPRFSVRALAELFGIEKEALDRYFRTASAPAGEVAGGKRLRTFSLAETRQIAEGVCPLPRRPDGAPGYVIATVNFKGGSSKTSTAFNLAQGLALRGRKVLLVDLDAQGSATVLTGLMPDLEIEEADTAAVIMPSPDFEAQTSFSSVIRKTYWDGLDIVPAGGGLNSAELLMPKLAATKDAQWWLLLDRALENHRQEYDYIIIDTAPSLSYMGMVSIFAADHLLMPLPPEQLDFSASITFWSNVWEYLSMLESSRNYIKAFKNISVLFTRTRNTDVSGVMRQFISSAYGRWLLPVQIPFYDTNSAAGIAFGTAYDLSDDGVARVDSRLRRAYDELVMLIDASACSAKWGSK